SCPNFLVDDRPPVRVRSAFDPPLVPSRRIMLTHAPSRLIMVAVCSWATWLAATNACAQTFVLDPSSASLATIPATAGSLLTPAAAPAPGPAAPPVVARTEASLNLLPGDVIDGVS